MINHYLLTLTAQQENRVLMKHMGGINRRDDLSNTCLVMAANPGWNCVTAMFRTWRWHNSSAWIEVPPEPSPQNCVAKRYDFMCDRFGVARVNAAIRNRILSNRANRVLRHAPQLEAV